MMINSSRLPLASVPLLIALVAAPASAQNVPAAEALFNKGLEEMNAGRYKTGCAAIGESYRLDPLPGAVFALAECHAKAGNIATAVARYDEYLRVFAGLSAAQQAKQRAKGRDKTAAAQKAALGPKVPELTLTLPASAPKGTRVMQDEVELGAASLGIGLPLDPGDHVVTTQAPGGPVVESRFTIAEGERKRLELTVQLKGSDAKATPPSKPAPAASTPPPSASGAPAATARPAATAPPQAPARTGMEASKSREAPPSSGASSGYRIGMYSAWGVGAAGLVAGLVTGGLALGKQGAIEDGCDAPVGGTVACDPEGLMAAQSAQKLELASTIGFGLALAGVATGVLLLVLEPNDPAIGDAKRWVGAGIASSGSAGATVIVEGSW